MLYCLNKPQRQDNDHTLQLFQNLLRRNIEIAAMRETTHQRLY